MAEWLNPAQGVEGKIRLVPSKTKISKGETITVDVYGIGLKNVNSFSVNIPVDSANIFYDCSKHYSRYCKHEKL